MCLVSGLCSSKIPNLVHACKAQRTDYVRMTEVKTDPARVRALAGQAPIPPGPGLTEGRRTPTVLPHSSPLTLGIGAILPGRRRLARHKPARSGSRQRLGGHVLISSESTGLLLPPKVGFVNTTGFPVQSELLRFCSPRTETVTSQGAQPCLALFDVRIRNHPASQS